jgi:hypothetical protein
MVNPAVNLDTVWTISALFDENALVEFYSLMCSLQ